MKIYIFANIKWGNTIKLFSVFIFLLLCGLYYKYNSKVKTEKLSAALIVPTKEDTVYKELKVPEPKKNGDKQGRYNIEQKDQIRRTEDVIIEIKNIHKKWEVYLRDAFVHRLNLEEKDINNYENLVEEHSRPFDKLIKLISSSKGKSPKKHSEAIAKMVALQKVFKLKKEKILGSNNIKIINKEIIPEFNRIYGNRTIIKSF